MTEIQHTNGYDKQVIALYKTGGRQAAKKEFKLTDSQLYTMLGKNGVRLKNGKLSTSHKRPEVKEEPKPRKMRKARKALPTRDALIYLGKAQDKLITQIEDGVEDAPLILGLVALAIDALEGRP